MGRPKSIRKGRYWPSFESPFLADVASALRKRGKAIKHQVGAYSCERVWYEEDDGRFEKAELYFESLNDRPFRISCHLWDDRWLWIDVRQATISKPVEKGWAFEWSHEGRVGDAPPQDIIDAVEKSISATHGNDPAHIKSELSDLWTPIAVNGPIGPA